MTPTHRAARGLAALGLCVLPTVDRRPAIRRWPEHATTDPARIDQWWARWPDADPGVATGPSCLVVLDIDGPPGWASLRELEAMHGGPLPPTLAVRTGRPHGEHRYYAAPQRAAVQSCTRLHGLDGLDVRAAGGYVWAPGARHPAGRTYRWRTRERPSLALLRSLLAALPTAPECICTRARARVTHRETSTSPISAAWGPL